MTTNQLITKIGRQRVLTALANVVCNSSGGGTWGSITGTLTDQTDLNNALALKLDATVTYKTKSDSHTLDSDDLADLAAGKDLVFLMTKSSGSTFTLPRDSSLAVASGKKFKVRRTHASGLVTMAAGSGATASGTYGDLLDPGLDVEFEVQKISADTWLVQNGASGAWVSYVPTLAGFSVQPTGIDFSYFMLGRKAAVIRWDMSASGGTSNSATFTMTMPFLARSQTRYPVFALNAGAFINTAQAYTAIGSNLISFFIGAGSFSASGAKGAFGGFVVEIQ